MHPFPSNVNNFSPANAYPHQMFPTQAAPPPLFSNFFHPAMSVALPSQLNAGGFAMVREHNTDYEKRTGSSVVDRPNISGNVAVGRSHQTALQELADVALQSHAQGRGRRN
jgi:hypothetical protein